MAATVARTAAKRAKIHEDCVHKSSVWKTRINYKKMKINIATWHACYALCSDLFQSRDAQIEAKESAKMVQEDSGSGQTLYTMRRRLPLCLHWGRSKAVLVAVGISDKVSFDCMSGTVSGTMEANALCSRELDDLWRLLRLWISPRTIDNGRFTWVAKMWNIIRESTSLRHRLKENWNNLKFYQK